MATTENEKPGQQGEKPDLRIVRQFNVAPEVVFDAFTDPKSMKVWWTDDTTFDIDLRVGGRWTITREEGDVTYTMTGEYLEVERPYRLRYTIAMPQFSPNSDIITIDITPDWKGGCEVAFVQSGNDIAAELQELPPGEVSESEKGWQQGFDLMEAAWKKRTLLFELSVNKENNTVNVKREFAANLDLVWDAWTKPELLDQWWAPKPYQAKTKSMDFREGGVWLYAMISPENEIHWSRNDYHKIEPKKSFTALDVFCDEDGNVNHEMPGTLWNNVFSEADGITLVTVTAKYESLADLEKIIELGFKEGFTMALGNLDDLLLTLSK